MPAKRLLPVILGCLLLALILGASFVHLNQANAPARTHNPATGAETPLPASVGNAPKVANLTQAQQPDPVAASPKDERAGPVVPTEGEGAPKPSDDPTVNRADKTARTREEAAKALMEEFIKRVEDEERATAAEPPLASFSGMVRDGQFNAIKSAEIRGSYEVTLTLKDGRSIQRAVYLDLGVSDANGFYRARLTKQDLPVGAVVPERIDLTVTAKHGSFLLLEPVRLALARGEDRAGVDIGMTQGGELTGRCVDEQGNPVQFVRVQFTRVQLEFNHSRRRTYFSALTDEHGRFTVSGLMEGHYALASVARAGWQADLAATMNYPVAFGVATDTGIYVLTRVTAVLFTLDYGSKPERGGGALAGGPPELVIEAGGTKTRLKVISAPQTGTYVAEVKDITGSATLYLKIPGFKIPDNPEGRFEVQIRHGEHHDLGTLKPQWDTDGQPIPPRRAR